MSSTNQRCDLLVIAPHPDDAEIGCGGTMLKMLDAGKRVVIADLTAGEMGSRGTRETRAEEAAAAGKVLGLKERRNLGLPDSGLENSEAMVRPIVQLIRELTPKVVAAPWGKDAHPDHQVAAQLAHRARFLSGLVHFAPELGPARRPDLLIHYPGNDPVEPSFCIDISSVADRKEEVLRCYGTQVQVPDPSHLLRKRDILERVQVRDAYWGAQTGVRAAEPYWTDAPLLLGGLSPLLRELSAV